MKRNPVVHFLTCAVAVFPLFSRTLATNTYYFFDPVSCTDNVDKTNIDVQIQRAASLADYVKISLNVRSDDDYNSNDYLDQFLGAQSSSSNLNTASAIFAGGTTRVNNRPLQRIEGVASYTRGGNLFSNVNTAGNLVKIRALCNIASMANF